MMAVRTRDMVMSCIKRHRTISIPAGTNAVVIRKEPVPWQRANYMLSKQLIAPG